MNLCAADYHQTLSQMGVSANRGPQYSTLNSRSLITRPPNKVPLIFRNSQMVDLGAGYIAAQRFCRSLSRLAVHFAMLVSIRACV